MVRANALSALYASGMASGHQQLQLPKFSASERLTDSSEFWNAIVL